MKTINVGSLVLLFSLLLGGTCSLAQDRNIANNVVYPDGAFIQNGGRVIDVTQPPYNAAGDGVTDDTEAIIAAYTFVTDSLQRFGWQDPQNRGSYLLYFPAGTYLVSNTIIHDDSLFFEENGGTERTEGAALIRMVGQNRETTTIRLKDNCPGFEAGAEKPVVSFQKANIDRREGTNIPASNQLSDITINTGRGNPGATGALFLGANISEIRNVTIKSEDGAGFTGLDLSLSSTVGYYRDITVEGFDNGMRVITPDDVAPTLEYLTLRNQNQVGILVADGSPSIRRLVSTNPGPAVQMIGDKAQVVLIDSYLWDGDPSQAAIDWQDTVSQLFVRNVLTSGYQASIRKAGVDVVTGTVEEYVSGQVYTLFEDVDQRSLGLPITESPVLEWEQDTAQWANVDDYPGANDSEKIQNAMNSGRSVVYFPRSQYEITTPVTIPASVRHIDFMYTQPGFGDEFIISESASDTLFIDHVSGRGSLIQAAPRALVMRHLSLGNYRYTSDQPSELFLESVVNVGYAEDFCPPPLNIWARSINDENKETSNFKVYGGTMWVLGFKTEGGETSFDAQRGGTLEVLGGTQIGTEEEKNLPYVHVDSATVSFIGHTFLGSAYEFVVTETQSGITRSLRRGDVPERPQSNIVRRDGDIFVPLYVGRAGASTPVTLVPVPLSATPGLAEAQLVWSNRNADTSTYEIRYRRSGISDWTSLSDIPDTTVTVSGLAPAINYEWQVRVAVDTASAPADWSSLATFTTDIAAQRTTALTIDGTPDEASWQITAPITKLTSDASGPTATFGVLWDDTNLYVAARVLDNTPFNDSEAVFQDDGVEVYLDVNNNGGSYDSTDNQLILGYQDDSLFAARPVNGTIQYATVSDQEGYAVELAIPWSSLGVTPEAGLILGFDIAVNDDQDGGGRDGQQVWAGTANNFASTSAFGDVVLSVASEVVVSVPSETRPALSRDGLRIYPNASDGQFYVEASQRLSLRVYNAFGQPISNQTLEPNRKNMVDLTAQPAGVYLFRAGTADGMTTHRVLKR